MKVGREWSGGVGGGVGGGGGGGVTNRSLVQFPVNFAVFCEFCEFYGISPIT